MFKRRKIEQPYEGRIEPFRIIGNVYFVGTFQSSCHIIDTGDGLILIDTGYSNVFYLVIRSIYKLGFKPEDIKYIIHRFREKVTSRVPSSGRLGLFSTISFSD